VEGAGERGHIFVLGGHCEQKGLGVRSKSTKIAKEGNKEKVGGGVVHRKLGRTRGV